MRLEARLAALAAAGVAAIVLLTLLLHHAFFSVEAKLRRIDAPGVYFLGTEFEGLELTHVRAPDEGEQAEFGYGECRRRGSRLDPFDFDRCDYPLFVTVSEVDPDATDPEVEPGYPQTWLGPCVRTTVRGVPAAVTGPPDDGLQIYAGTTTIAVMTTPDRMLRAARSLRPVGGSWERRLPAPRFEVDEPLRKCRRDPRAFEPMSQTVARLARDDPTIPFAGLEFDDAPLMRVRRGNGMLGFLYEGCGTSEILLGCESVLAIDVEPAQHVRLPRDCTRYRVKGVPAAYWEEIGDSGSRNALVVFTGGHAATIWGDAILADDLDAEPLLHDAGALRTVGAPDAAAASLPPPTETPTALRRCTPG